VEADEPPASSATRAGMGSHLASLQAPRVEAAGEIVLPQARVQAVEVQDVSSGT